MAGPFDFLHIKGRTAGSSNELSFDVLDAARNGLDDKKSRTSRAPSGPKPSQGTYHGVAGTSTLSAVPEVERRKKARRARSARLWVLTFLVLAALVGSAAFFGVRFYQQKVDFNGHFNTLIERLVEVDKTLVEVETLMKNPLDATQETDRTTAVKQLSQMERELDSIADEAASMKGGTTSDTDEVALEQVQDAAKARRAMFVAAEDAFTLSDQVAKQAKAADDAWMKVLKADEQARAATAAANAATTTEATEQARNLTEEALEVLNGARADLEAVNKQVPSVSFSKYFAYIDKRAEALNAALQTADALLAWDRTDATAANETYNQADRAAVALAEELTESVGELVKASFDERLARIKDDYSSARAQAATADSALRAYLPN